MALGSAIITGQTLVDVTSTSLGGRRKRGSGTDVEDDRQLQRTVLGAHFLLQLRGVLRRGNRRVERLQVVPRRVQTRWVVGQLRVLVTGYYGCRLQRGELVERLDP